MLNKFDVALCALLVFALSGCSGDAEPTVVSDNETEVSAPESKMTLVGDVSSRYHNGNFVVWTPKEGGSSGAMMVASVPASKSGTDRQEAPKRDPIYDTLDVVAEAPIAADGTFSLSVDVDEPKEVFFYVLDATSESGGRMGAVKGQNFVLEPGALSLKMDDRSRFVIDGGKYNDIVFNSWRKSEKYLAVRDEYRKLLKAVEGETEEERRSRIDRMMEKQSEVFDLEGEGRAQVAMNHPDPLARKLTIQTAWLIGPWVLESLRSLAQLTPDDPWVISKLASAEESAAKRAAERKIAVGTEILDFSAETLSGETVLLSDVRADSEVVLLEFWASWCGPCISEIPHMKEAYATYKEKGFEIVSFTIDDTREDWVEASDEHELPWLNLGMGPAEEAPVMYNVTGVPKNYLIESSTGAILAKDLRGHKLDEELKERFL